MKKINLKEVFKPKNKLVDPTKIKITTFPFARDWKILISIFAVGLIVLSAFAWRVFLSDHIGGGYLTLNKTESIEPPLRTISLERLNKDLDLLETRRTDFEKAIESLLKLIDPSL